MNDIIKRIQNFELIKILYSHTLFDIESICEKYGYWEILSEDEKLEYDEISKRKKEEAARAVVGGSEPHRPRGAARCPTDGVLGE